MRQGKSRSGFLSARDHVRLPYLERTGEFIVEGLVEGECPVCLATCRGGLCETCCHPNNFDELLNPHSTVDPADVPTPREVTILVFPMEEYREQLAEARHEASRLREEAKEQGIAIKAELRAEGEAERQRIVDAAHAQLEADRQQALTSLRAEVGALAVELAGRIVGESLEDEARQRRTVDRFLAELEEQSGSTTGARATS